MNRFTVSTETNQPFSISTETNQLFTVSTETNQPFTVSTQSNQLFAISTETNQLFTIRTQTNQPFTVSTETINRSPLVLRPINPSPLVLRPIPIHRFWWFMCVTTDGKHGSQYHLATITLVFDECSNTVHNAFANGLLYGTNTCTHVKSEVNARRMSIWILCTEYFELLQLR